MQTIIIKLDSTKLINPDLDIRYLVPDYLETHTNGEITDNGYDYLSNTELALWLAAPDAASQVQTVIQCLKAKRFCGNDLSLTAQIYISDQEAAPFEECTEVSFTPNQPKEGQLPNYVKVLDMKDQNIVETYFIIEMQKPFALGNKLNEINEKAYMNGYNWEALLDFYLKTNLPDLLEGMSTDSEAGNYVAYFENSPENVHKATQLAELIAYLIEDEEDLCEIVRTRGEEIEWD